MTTDDDTAALLCSMTGGRWTRTVDAGAAEGFCFREAEIRSRFRTVRILGFHADEGIYFLINS